MVAFSKKGDPASEFVLFSVAGFSGSGVGVEVGGFVKKSEAPSSSFVMLSIFSFFFIYQKARE